MCYNKDTKMRERKNKMNSKIGYRWYVTGVDGEYEPQEITYLTLPEAQQAMEEYLSPNFPRSKCGIDKVMDDDGCIEVLENIILPLE